MRIQATTLAMAALLQLMLLVNILLPQLPAA